MVALVKPQFEVGREHLSQAGIVRDPAIEPTPKPPKLPQLPWAFRWSMPLIRPFKAETETTSIFCDLKSVVMSQAFPHRRHPRAVPILSQEVRQAGGLL